MLWNVITTQALLPISRISFCFLASGYSYHNRPKITVISQGYHALLMWSHRKILYYYVIFQTTYPWSNYKKNQTQTDDSLQDTWLVLFNPVSHGKKAMTELLFYNRGDEGTQTISKKTQRRSLGHQWNSKSGGETPAPQMWRFLSTPPLKSVIFH